MKGENGLKTVNTVLGPIDTNKIGVTLMHEHLLGATGGIPQIYPELLGPNYKERIIKGLIYAKQGGVDTVVEAATMDLGRDVKVLAETSRASGMNVIAATGWNLEVPGYLGKFDSDRFAEIFTREIRVGIEGTDIKAGIIKSAADFVGLTPSEEITLRGVARAHLATGIPIMLHSYSPGQVGREQLAVLKEEGVDLSRVKVDHSMDTMDVEYLIWIVKQGCYLGMDRIPGLHVKHETFPSPDARIGVIKAMIDAGYADRLLLSHDTFLVSSFFDTLPASVQELNATENPYGFLYINKVVVPKLQKLGVPEKTIQGILADNPGRFFEGS